MLVASISFGAHYYARRREAQQLELERAMSEVRENERRQIGQDLHDDLGQDLAGVMCLSTVLEQNLMTTPSGDEAERAAEITELLSQAIDKTRYLAKGLIPLELEENELASALKTFAANVENRFKISCFFACDTPVDIQDDTVTTHLYHIVKEAVHNAIEHGHATHVDIGLGTVYEKIVLVVKDDGGGFPGPLDDRKSVHRGMGVHIMRYRASLMGGSLDVQPHTDGGILVTCSVPKVTNRHKNCIGRERPWWSFSRTVRRSKKRS